MSHYGICLHSLIALRQSPSEKAELVSQLLFGETYMILEKQDKWLNITSTNDEYDGWINSNLHTPIEALAHQELSTRQWRTAHQTLTPIKKPDGTQMLLPMGSKLCGLKNNSLEISEQHFSIAAFSPLQDVTGNTVAELARLFLNTPYLWGGKTVMGMDCSGLVQVCFTAADIQLPRDSNEQVDQGENVSFIDEALPGDLAFFDDDEGNIVHVGIISGTRKIIHAFGFVREDTLDHQGIFNSETHAYSHKLRVIKRLID